MKKTFHLMDTCIWRDFYENRFSKAGNPIGKYAADLFIKVIKTKSRILFSEALVWELKRDYSEKEIERLLKEKKYSSPEWGLD